MLFASPIYRADDANGRPVPGALLYFYAPGTLTPAVIYSNAALTTPLANPVTADAGGLFPEIHLDPAESYRVVLKTAAGSTIADRDNYDPVYDGALRADLAASDGASLIGYGDTTAEAELDSLHRHSILALQGRKTFARNFAEATEMADDLSEMVGYAAHAGTTGGAGQTIYKVWNSSDNAAVDGSFRNAVAKAIANGGGRIIFSPRGQFEIRLEKILIIYGSNITIDAPGRNVRIGALNDVEMIRVGDTRGDATNIIIRRLELFRYPHLSSADGSEYVKDGLSVIPLYADKVWVDQCTFTEHSDGAFDCANSALDTTDTPVRFTVSRCLFRRQDKTTTLGTTITSTDPAPAWASTALAQDPVVQGTFYKNVYEGAAQRCPRVAALAFAHKVNNVHLMSAYRRDDGTESACYGGFALVGGKILSEGDLFRLASPTTVSESAPTAGTESAGGAIALWAVTDPWDDATNYGPGAIKSTGSVAENSLIISEANIASVTVPPYTLTPEAVPDAGEAREAWVNGLIADAGAAVCPASDVIYRFVDTATGDAEGLYDDGYHVIKIADGYLVRMRDAIRSLTFSSVDPIFYTERGNNLTIASGVLDITGLSNSYFEVLGEGGAADDLVSITSTETIPNGLHLYIFGTGGQPITVKTTGNIGVTADKTLNSTNKVLHLIYNTLSSNWAVVGDV